MAAIAQLGERQTEDLKVLGSIPGLGSNAQLAVVDDRQDRASTHPPPDSSPGCSGASRVSWTKADLHVQRQSKFRSHTHT